MSAEKQYLFMERVLWAFAVKKRQVRHISAARFTAESWDLQCDCCCLLAHVLAEMAAARAADGSAVFPAAQLLKARRRAIEGHLDKI